MVSVHSTGPSRPDVGPGLALAEADAGPGLAPAMADPRVGPTWEPDSRRTKPECYGKQRGSESISLPVDCDPAYAEA